MGADTNIIFLREKNGHTMYRAQVTRKRGRFKRSASRTFPTLEEAVGFRDRVTAEFEKELAEEERRGQA